MRVLISGGGTGGHLFPAIAVAQALSQKDPDGKVLYVGRRGGIEETIVPGYGIAFATIVAPKVDMEQLWRNWKVPALLPAALWQSFRVLRGFRPDVFLGTGGYVSAPLILAAAGSGVPVVLQEQNYIPGRATRMLARLAKVVATAYVDSGAYLRSRRVVVTGTPVRRDFQNARVTFPQTPRKLLVVGGSQGAHRINQAVAEAISDLLRVDEVEVSHQTGPADLAEMETVRAALPQEMAGRYRPFAFAEDLPSRLQSSDLVISRAGASTISETGALGIPMVLIPGPFAGGHQKYNAKPFADAGAAVIIPNEECDGKRLTSELIGIIKNPARYRAMVDAMRSMGRPNAADDVVALLQEVARH